MNNASLELGGDNWAEKDASLLGYTVSDDSGRFYPREFTFARGSNLSATRVGADGLIEKGRENLLLQSNTFSDAAWLKGSITPTGGQAGYDGTNDAWKIEVNTSSTSARLQQGISQNICTYSVYAKEGNTPSLGLKSDISVPTWFDLSGSGSVTLGSGCVDASITSVGDGWFRCSVTFPVVTSVRFYVSDSVGSFPVSGGAYLYIQDAQLEIGLAATDYIESGASTGKAGLLENTPRLDYSGGSTCPSLLLEPQRTNRLVYSEYSGYYNYQSSLSVTDNAATSPEGVQNAIKISKSSNGYQFFRRAISAATGTLSVFAKKGNYRYIGLRNNQVSGSDHSVFDFDTETFVNVASGQTCTFEDYGDGWYRLSAYQPTNESSGLVGIALSDENGAEFLGSNIADGSHFYIYGLQLESGSYPTSYIPTYGTSQTRGADRPQILNTTTDVLSQTAFTLFFEADLTSDTINNFRDIVAFRGASKELRFETRTDNSVRVQSNMTTSGDNFNSATIGDTDNKKFAMTFTTSQVRLYADGSLVGTYNGAYSSDLVHILFMNSTSLGVETKTNFKQYLLFTSGLSNDECITLTTI